MNGRRSTYIPTELTTEERHQQAEDRGITPTALEAYETRMTNIDRLRDSLDNDDRNKYGTTLTDGSKYTP